jgi:hypothetical protein
VPGRGAAVADVVRGFAEVHRATFALGHGREFVGLLRVPVSANAIVCSALAAVGLLLLWPVFAAAFATPWWLADGLRSANRDRGPALWLLATWLVLGPPLLEAFAGALQEPLHVAAERAMLGTSPPPGQPRGWLPRLRDRARLCLAALAIWPLSLGLVLLPYAGVPLVAVLGSALAALVWLEQPLAQRGFGLAPRIAVVWRNRWRALGLGAGVQAAAAVPFLNLLGLSAVATVAAASTYLKFDKAPR